MLEILKVFVSSLNNSSIDMLNIEDSFFSDDILGSNRPDSYFEIVAGSTLKTSAISF